MVRRAFEEDVGRGDATTLATIPPSLHASAAVVARESLVLSGVAIAEVAFRMQSRNLQIKKVHRDGERLSAGGVIMTVRGPARAILVAERVALNFLQRLSGIATLTAAFVKETRGTSAKILDTRKTTPGLRMIEKYAVTCGGGKNHRFGLDDMVLIKDNHLAALRQKTADPIQGAVQRARNKFPHLCIEVETDNLQQVNAAVAAGADIILLDNMSLSQMRRALVKIQGRAKTEASGGVKLARVRSIAKTGVDYISVGAITHSARAVDIALDFRI